MALDGRKICGVIYRSMKVWKFEK